MELASAMAREKFCIATTPEELLFVLNKTDFDRDIRPYPVADLTIFPRLIDSLFAE